MKGLIIWAHSNCRSTMALYREVKSLINSPVIIALWQGSEGAQCDIRQNVGFREDEFSDIKMIPVGEDYEKGVSLLDGHPGFNHLFAVYQGAPTFQRLILEAKRRGEKVGIMCESPCNMASGWRFALKELYMRFVLPRRIARVVKAADFFINFSGDDTHAAERNGWPKEKILPFGYFSPRIEGSKLVPRTTNRPFEILATGILAPYRGADILLEALTILKKRGVPYHATITQKGQMYGKMKAKVESERLPVDMPGFVEMKDLIRLYETCSVYVGSGRREPWGMRLNDALQCGAPLVVSRSMGGACLIDHYDCGLCYEKNSPEKLADALEILAQDQEVYKRVAVNAVKAAEEIEPERMAHVLIERIRLGCKGWL